MTIPTAHVLTGVALTLLAQTTFAAFPALLPLPREVKPTPGEVFMLGAESARITYDDELPGGKETATYAATELNRSTGLPLTVKAETTGFWPFRSTELGDLQFKFDATQPDEGYTLSVTSSNVVMAASTRAGAFYAFQTLRQLMSPKVYSKTVSDHTHYWPIPGVEITDAPRMKWRGIMIDDCRHFMGKEHILKQIDVIASQKFNTLHWHLTDDQGWRIEIKRYPQLMEKSNRRAESPIMWSRFTYDKTPYGPYYYTQEEIKEVIAYAAERNITIVPEIELPGHALAALAAFPELSCTGGPFQTGCRWGVEPDIFCAGNDETLRFLEGVLDEVIALFPSTYIHCGGDEAPKDRWQKCPKCQKRLADLGLKNYHELQSWFVQHFANYLKDRGRNLIGWDEILEGGLPKGAAVMSWRGVQGGIEAATMGHEVVMVPTSHLYLDYGQAIPGDPYEYNCGNVSIQRVYTLNPTDGIPEAMHDKVLGVSGNTWSEYIFNPSDWEWKAWPRACALAEINWTPQAQRNIDCFMARLPEHLKRLSVMDINFAHYQKDAKRIQPATVRAPTPRPVPGEGEILIVEECDDPNCPDKQCNQ